ncbi:hypothetical protein CCH79_00016201 [Gambusia affinis]|uniref:Signal recognition particle 19 kDa protein n=1 Tax=Gambusia affinis TaxID=33528 RepID=A0A315VM84_GAMAF|nr:hypothetical protein CCH79_00016201 [Gambusia affinis]
MAPRRPAALSLLVVFGLLILSTEGRGVQEKLSPDVTAGSFLRGKDEHLERSRFICVYPIYINSKKTLAEGRRIPTEKVCLSVFMRHRPGTDPVPTQLLLFCLQAVENPSCAEIRDVLTAAGMNVYVEVEPDRFPHRRSRVQTQHLIRPGSVLVLFVFQNKMHPREWNRDVQFRGRVRVQLKQTDGSLCQDKFRSRKDVMFYVAEMIPKLKTRTQKSGGSDSSTQQGEGGKKSKKKKK